jgi:hypothetical protein
MSVIACFHHLTFFCIQCLVKQKQDVRLIEGPRRRHLGRLKSLF